MDDLRKKLEDAFCVAPTYDEQCNAIERIVRDFAEERCKLQMEAIIAKLTPEVILESVAQRDYSKIITIIQSARIEDKPEIPPKGTWCWVRNKGMKWSPLQSSGESTCNGALLQTIGCGEWEYWIVMDPQPVPPEEEK